MQILIPFFKKKKILKLLQIDYAGLAFIYIKEALLKFPANSWFKADSSVTENRHTRPAGSTF